MRSYAHRLLVLSALLLAACSGEPPERPPGTGEVAPVAITDVTVIDAVDGPRPGQTVVVRGDRIEAVGPAVQVPEDARVFEGAGRYLIPGLWDMHVHLTYDPALTAAMPGLFLRWGVTSVRDTGGLLEEILPVVQSMRAPGARAPRVFFAGPLLDGRLVVYDGEGRPEIGIADATPEAARANVAALAEAGVDFVKIYEMVAPEVFDALVEAANERNLPIAAHVPLALRARDVAPRVNSMEHLRNVEMDCAADAPMLLETRRQILDSATGSGGDLRSRLHRLQRLPAVAAYDPATCREAIAAMDATIQVPTLRLNAFPIRPPFGQPDWPAALEELPAGVTSDWRAGAEAALESRSDTTFGAWSLELTRRMHEAGVPVGAGTDTPIAFALPGYSLHDELAMLVRAGMTTREALRSATLRPAEFFGLQGEMGRIAEGFRGDLVLLSADPLEDIGNAKAIEAVVARGRVMWPEEGGRE